MAVDTYEDLEPVENSLIRCDQCGKPFVEVTSLRRHKAKVENDEN